MTSLIRRLSRASDSDSSPSSSPPKYQALDKATASTAGRIYGARDWQLNAVATVGTEAERRKSIIAEQVERRASLVLNNTVADPTSQTGRVSGARDWRLDVPSAENMGRRQSIVEDYSGNATADTGEPSQRRASIPFGPRHFALAEKAKQESL